MYGESAVLLAAVLSDDVHPWPLCLCSRVVAVTLPAQERLAVRQALQALLSRLPADVLAARCVRPVQRYIESCVHAGLGATRVQVSMCWVQALDGKSASPAWSVTRQDACRHSLRLFCRLARTADCKSLPLDACRF